MDTLFLLLFFVSIIALIIGLIRPAIFTRFLKEKATRKGVGVIFGISTVVFFILFDITADTNTSTTRQDTIQTETSIVENIGLTLDTNLSNNILRVSGNANLPDGALISYEASHESWGTRIFSPTETDVRLADGTTEVKNGKYEFSINVTQWPSGNIETWVAFQTILGTTVKQPQGVIELYGEMGEKIPDASAIQSGSIKRVEKTSTARKQ